MKGMVSLLISLLLIAGLAAFAYKRWLSGASAPADEAPPPRFLARCAEVAPAKAGPPDPYCRCLWRRGVRNLARLLSDSKATKISASCGRGGGSP